MYIKPIHAELDGPTLQAFVQQYPFAHFTTAISHPKHDTIQTSHIPFVFDAPTPSTPHGVLRGHITRVNPQAKAMIDTLRPTNARFLEDDVQIIFDAPVHHYVPGRFFAERKATDGKTVPTWNYAAVQVYGKLKLYYANNDETSSFLQQQVEDLSGDSEKKYGGNWTVRDAPEKYVEMLKKSIIGMEIVVRKIEGRFKLSQEEKDGDWRGIVDGFKGLRTDAALQMAEMVEGRAGDKRSAVQ